jgi:uncharacterized protein (DUF2249 family)
MVTEDVSGDNDSVAGHNSDVVVLDVRPILERGEEPFGTIMQTVASLDGRSMLLVAPFDPTPLQGVLSAQGFSYRSEHVSDTEWRVSIGVEDATPDGAAPGPGPGARPETAAVAESPYTIKSRTPSAPTSPTSSEQPSDAASPDPMASTSPLSAVAMAMDPTANVPPAWLPLGFLAAAGAGLIGFGVATTITADSAVIMPRHDHVLAAVHLGVLAFLSTAVLGAVHQFGPVVGGRPLRSVRAGLLTGVLFVSGAWLIPYSFAAGHPQLLQLGGVLATTAVVIAAWNLSRPLSATGKGAPIVGLRLAVVYLVITAGFGVTYAFDRSHAWFPLLSDRVLAHAHLGLLGWLGLAYVAVAEKLWPMFLLAHRPHERDGERAVWLVGAGAPAMTLGLLFSIPVLTAVGGLVVVSGLAFHLASLASVIRHRRRSLELLHGFVLSSAACLVIAVVAGVVAGLAPMDADLRARLVVVEVFSLILWLTLAVIGHAHKIVPFISWSRLRDRGIVTGPDGRALLFAHLVNEQAARATLGLAVLGAGAGVFGALSATSALVGVAGISLGLAGTVAMANLVAGPLLIIRWHHRQPVVP